MKAILRIGFFAILLLAGLHFASVQVFVKGSWPAPSQPTPAMPLTTDKKQLEGLRKALAAEYKEQFKRPVLGHCIYFSFVTFRMEDYFYAGGTMENHKKCSLILLPSNAEYSKYTKDGTVNAQTH